MSATIDRLNAALEQRYRIERELGAGGMATVYLAHDLRHDRKVALKVLRPELSAILGGDRFLAEIKTTANLQHPHILSLFDSGEADGLVFYVMPFVQGESLRDRLSREKQLPVDEAVRIAREVADALNYAHQHGIVHRDIKPENILLHGGHALVADFGIALAASRSDGGTRMTETGMSLGTPHYMAPEQAMGEREITSRADIYALGCVLYEMLTAEPPFVGATAQAIIARVMTEEPRSLVLQRRTIPPHVEAAVRTALEKLPADRFATAAEFAAALMNPAYGEATGGVAARRAASRHPRSPSRQRLLAIAPWVLLAFVVLLAAAGGLRREAPRQEQPIFRFTMELPPQAQWQDQPGSAMALSPDGRVLVYSGRDSSGWKLFLRPMDRLEPVAVSGSSGARSPFFSPDGRWFGFTTDSRILKAPVAGGPAETICEAEAVGPTWLDSSSVVFADTSGLRRCSMAGTSTLLLARDSLAFITWPHALPGGRAVLFTERRGAVDRIGVLDLRNGKARQLDINGSNPRYVAAGYLVYASLDGLIRAVPFDPERLTVTGEPVVVAEGVRVGSGGAAKIAVSLSGVIVAALGESGQRALVLVSRQGVEDRLPVPLDRYLHPRVSPDGRQIAVGVGDAQSNIWVFDRQQGTLTRASFDNADTRPSWTPDGRRIVYVHGAGGTAMLRIVAADGSAPAESLLADARLQFYEVLFPANDNAMLVRSTSGSERDIWRLRFDSAGALQPLLRSPASEVTPAISPDGRWLAYASDESGRYEIYVRSYPGMGARYQVSLSGGAEPVWSPRGGELFYRNGPQMLVAKVRTETGFEVASRETLFSNADYGRSSTNRLYDVTPDGQHFLMIRGLAASTDVTVTLNWFDHLSRARGGATAP